ncbi:MAG: MBL fold metallo-hydrolase [Ignavibacteriaceae bacterium]|nr:MBL fold metallo-hydrolase [Ignavibacteriaceae bacterium]
MDVHFVGFRVQQMRYDHKNSGLFTCFFGNLLTTLAGEMRYSLVNLAIMKTAILPCGFLKVQVDEMFNQLPRERIIERYSVDNEGYMKISMNALVIEHGDQLVLLDPGCAEFLPSRLADKYGLEIPESMEKELNRLGYNPDQVTDVVFTHLHFDHGSGAFERVPGKIRKRFPNAEYHVLKEHFDYASKPDRKESNSFFTVFFRYIDRVGWLEEWKSEWMDFKVFNGHTRGMVVPRIRTSQRDIYYITDLVPMELFLEENVSSGYDLDPELAISEKQEFLNEIEKGSELIFFHDPLRDRKIHP